MASAWRDGDLLVMSLSQPLPARCVLCGRSATEMLGALTVVRGLDLRPFARTSLHEQRLPVCQEHFATWRRLAGFASWTRRLVSLLLVFFGIRVFLRSASGWFIDLRGFVITFLVLLAMQVFVEVKARPFRLRLARLAGGYAWLEGQARASSTTSRPSPGRKRSSFFDRPKARGDAAIAARSPSARTMRKIMLGGLAIAASAFLALVLHDLAAGGHVPLRKWYGLAILVGLLIAVSPVVIREWQRGPGRRFHR